MRLQKKGLNFRFAASQDFCAPPIKLALFVESYYKIKNF